MPWYRIRWETERVDTYEIEADSLEDAEEAIECGECEPESSYCPRSELVHAEGIPEPVKEQA